MLIYGAGLLIMRVRDHERVGWLVGWAILGVILLLVTCQIQG